MAAVNIRSPQLNFQRLEERLWRSIWSPVCTREQLIGTAQLFLPQPLWQWHQREEESKGLVVEVQKSSASLRFLAPPQISCTVWGQWQNLSVPPFLLLWSMPVFLSLQLGKTCSGQGKQMFSCINLKSLLYFSKTLGGRGQNALQISQPGEAGGWISSPDSSVMQRIWIPPSWWQKLWCQEDKDSQYFTAGSALKYQWKAAVLKRSLRHKSDQVNQFIGCY